MAIVLSIVYVPFGVFSALEFTGPIFAAVITYAVYSTWPSRVSFVGLLIIVAGATALITSNFSVLGIVLLLPVAGTLILTGTNMMLRHLSRGHRLLTMLLLMNLIQLPVYLLLAWMTGHAKPVVLWELTDYAAIIGLSASGLITQFSLAMATRYGTDLQISALDTIRIPAVSAAAYLVFAERLGGLTIGEIGVIMVGALTVAFGRMSQRYRPDVAAV